MMVIPAVDIREGRCVQLVGGSYDQEVISLDDPLAAAERWSLDGFKALHLVDLDAATGRGANAEIVERIIASSDSAVQVGGGIRTSEQISRLFAAGAHRVIVGTRAFEDRAWLEEIAAAHPDTIIVAADVRDRTLVTRGWRSSRDDDIGVAIAALNDLPLAGLLVTAVHREGLMQGPDALLIAQAAAVSMFPVQASGGIASAEDLSALSNAGAAAAIVGMALYTGALSAAEINGGKF